MFYTTSTFISLGTAMYNGVGQIKCCLNVGYFDGDCFDTVIHSQSRPIVLVEIMNCYLFG